MKVEITAANPVQNDVTGTLYVKHPDPTHVKTDDDFSIMGEGLIAGQKLGFGVPVANKEYIGTVNNDGTLLVYGTAVKDGDLNGINVITNPTLPLGQQTCLYNMVAPAAAAPVPGIALLVAVAPGLAITQADFPPTFFQCSIGGFTAPVKTQIGGFVFLSEQKAAFLAAFLGASLAVDYCPPWTPDGFPSLVGEMPKAQYLVLGGVRVLAGAVGYLIMVGTPNLQQQLTNMFSAS